MSKYENGNQANKRGSGGLRSCEELEKDKNDPHMTKFFRR